MFQQLEALLSKDPLQKEFSFSRADLQIISDNFKQVISQANQLSRENTGLRGVLVKLGLGEDGEPTKTMDEFKVFVGELLTEYEAGVAEEFDEAEKHYNFVGSKDLTALVSGKCEEFEPEKFTGWLLNKKAVLDQLFESAEQDEIDTYHNLKGQVDALEKIVAVFKRVAA